MVIMIETKYRSNTCYLALRLRYNCKNLFCLYTTTKWTDIQHYIYKTASKYTVFSFYNPLYTNQLIFQLNFIHLPYRHRYFGIFSNSVFFYFQRVGISVCYIQINKKKNSFIISYYTLLIKFSPNKLSFSLTLLMV